MFSTLLAGAAPAGLILAILVLPSCNVSRSKSNPGNAPENAVQEALASPAAASTPGGNQGGQLFSEMACDRCHGADGKGKMPGTPDFTGKDWQAKHTDGEILSVIKDGKIPMPPYGSRLSDQQVRALVNYVRGFTNQ